MSGSHDCPHLVQTVICFDVPVHLLTFSLLQHSQTTLCLVALFLRALSIVLVTYPCLTSFPLSPDVQNLSVFQGQV